MNLEVRTICWTRNCITWLYPCHPHHCHQTTPATIPNATMTSHTFHTRSILNSLIQCLQRHLRWPFLLLTYLVLQSRFLFYLALPLSLFPTYLALPLWQRPLVGSMCNSSPMNCLSSLRWRLLYSRLSHHQTNNSRKLSCVETHRTRTKKLQLRRLVVNKTKYTKMDLITQTMRCVIFIIRFIVSKSHLLAF